MQNFILFIKSQRNQIQEGGWPAVNRKIRRLTPKDANQIPLLHGVGVLLSLGRYLLRTLTRRHYTANLRRFGSEFSDLIQQNTTYQSNKTNILLMEAQRCLMAENINGAMALYEEAAVNDSHRAESYFGMASLFHLQGKYDCSTRRYETGLKVLQKESVEKGLELFAVKIISTEGWGFNIGHTSHLEVLVKLGILGRLSAERHVVFVCSEFVANLCYLNYWKRYLDFVLLDKQQYRCLSSFFRPISEHLTMLQLKEGFVGLYSAWNLAEKLWHSENRPPLLELNENDRERGHEILKQWSISSQSWFVCIHVREGDPRITRSGPDSDILTYLPAIKAITSRGGYVIRMGHRGMKELPHLPNLFDYANSAYKSDWMDVFLWASCKFFIGTSSGPLTVPPTFGKPVLYSNAVGIGMNPKTPNSFMLPKLFWSKEKRRFFTFKEMLDSPIGWTVSRVFDGIDGDLMDNTPEEIEAAVIEMLGKLENSPGSFNDLSDLQKRFNTLRQQYGDTGQYTISETFVQRHSDLLG